MFKTLRNIIVILVALLVFIFFFAGMGVFDDLLPLVQTKSAIVLLVNSKEEVIDMEQYGYISKSENKDRLIAAVLEDGYVLVSIDGDTYVLQKDGVKETFTASSFLWKFTILEPKK